MIPGHVTHYYEADRGPFLNVCDLPEDRWAALIDAEKDAPTSFNRFAMGKEFLTWRREADDLLIRSYREKFGREPEGRPYFGLLGSFDVTFGMFRQGRKLELEVDAFEPWELTFMYPDHSHLLSFYGSDVPPLFYDLPEEERYRGFRGKLFTFQELCAAYRESGIGAMIETHLSRGSWAGSYVETHLWRRSLRHHWLKAPGPAASGSP